MTPFVADETETWSRARSGDGRAFATVFDLHRDRVLRHAGQLTASTSDAEDVVAAAFFELWRKRDTVPVVNGSTLPWLLVTATNLARSGGRGVRRYRAAIDRLPRSKDLVDPAETAEERIRRQELLGAIRSLGDRDAALLLLTSLQGYSTVAAAEVLGLSAVTARVRLHRARKKLQARLAADHPWFTATLREGDAS